MNGVYDVPKAIKQVGKDDAVMLSKTAQASHIGVGRHVTWLDEHIPDSAAGALWAILRDGHRLRCLIVLRRHDKKVETFTMDVLPEDFDRLPDLTGERLVQFTRWALSHVPIDPPPER
jgi:hypothetical protein